MGFHAYEVALELVREVREPIARIRTQDRSLADQAQRAAQSVVLNVAEGAQRLGRDRVQHYAIAAGSAAELRSALDVAIAWGYVEAGGLGQASELLARERAMLWRLTRGTGG